MRRRFFFSGGNAKTFDWEPKYLNVHISNRKLGFGTATAQLCCGDDGDNSDLICVGRIDLYRRSESPGWCW